MRALQWVLVAFALAFLTLVIVANRGCAPKYFQRGDVIALLLLSLVFAVALAWSAAGDADLRRSAGSLASAGLAAVFLSTVSLPMFVAPLAVVGAMRLPRDRVLRLRTEIALPLVVLGVWALETFGQSTVAPERFICP